MFVNCKYHSFLQIYIMCVRVCLILIVCITFCYNAICVNYNVYGRLCVQYKYNINLYN